MDFSTHQDQARANTWKLLFLFALAMLVFLVAVNLLPYLFKYWLEPTPITEYLKSIAHSDPWWKWHKFITLTTCFVVAVGMISHMGLLAKGGVAVAESLGATEVTANTTDPHLKRFHNVVAEMAIASGVPMPSTYVMEHEYNINAFAAGFSLSDSVVCVTRGCLEYLTRDELQGVVAHEFSHIFNGDMRLNMRLSGFLSGLMFLSFLGEMAVRAVGSRERFRYSTARYRRRDSHQGELVVLGVGAFLWLVGYLGFILGKLVQSSISREREYLADASAVQFTRNPLGIGGALIKIGGLSSNLVSPKAGQYDHMYISSGVQSYFDSHPPLDERIQRIIPQFDGQFFEPQKINLIEEEGKEEMQNEVNTAQSSIQMLDHEFLAAGFPMAIALALTLTPEHQDQQLNTATEKIDERQSSYLNMLSKKNLDFQQRFQVLELLAPAIRKMSKADLKKLKTAVTESIKLSEKSTIFDMTLYYLIKKQLERTLRPADFIPKPQLKLRHCQFEIAQLLGTLAHVGHQDRSTTESAFQAGGKVVFRKKLNYSDTPLKKWKDYFAVIDKLVRLSAKDRSLIYKALEATAKHDHKITNKEARHLMALNLIFNLN